MAGTFLDHSFEGVTLVVGSWKAVAAVKAASNHPVKVLGFRCGAGGVAGSAKPLDFRMRWITAGNGTATTRAPQKTNKQIPHTVQATGKVDFTGTQPTDAAGGNLTFGHDKFHPQGGVAHERSFKDLVIPGGEELAFELFTPSAETAVTVSGHIDLVE